MRAWLVTLLVVAGCSSPAPPVPPDQRAPDLAPDKPPLVWNDLRADQPRPDVRAPDQRAIDQKINAEPVAHCADGTPIFQCSTQKPYVCNAATLLEHKCSKCGCPGNQQCVTATEACQPVTLSLTATADSYINEWAPTTNYGTSTGLSVGWNSGTAGLFAAFLAFDLSSIPAKATIDKATLTLFQSYVFVSGTVKANLVQDPWAELLLTFQNAPQVLATPEAQKAIGMGSNAIDVQALVQAWVDSPSVLHGFRIAPVSGSSKLNFYSRENSGNAPSLTVVYR
jgi:hypothetical protein